MVPLSYVSPSLCVISFEDPPLPALDSINPLQIQFPTLRVNGHNSE